MHACTCPGCPLEAACGTGRALPVSVGHQDACGFLDPREECRGLRALGGQGLELRAGPEGTGWAEPPKVGHPVPDAHLTRALPSRENVHAPVQRARPEAPEVSGHVPGACKLRAAAQVETQLQRRVSCPGREQLCLPRRRARPDTWHGELQALPCPTPAGAVTLWGVPPRTRVLPPRAHCPPVLRGPASRTRGGPGLPAAGPSAHRPRVTESLC